jgi:hypothetical protein
MVCNVKDIVEEPVDSHLTRVRFQHLRPYRRAPSQLSRTAEPDPGQA